MGGKTSAPADSRRTTRKTRDEFQGVREWRNAWACQPGGRRRSEPCLAPAGDSIPPRSGGCQRKTPATLLAGASCLDPGSDLLSHGSCHTIIGAERFHFRVRNGIGWFPLAIAAREFCLTCRGLTTRNTPNPKSFFALTPKSHENIADLDHAAFTM